MTTEANLTGLIRRVLAETPIRRVRERLGGSHTVVTYPPLDALDEMPAGAEEPFTVNAPQGPLHYYIHAPACEHLCSFCHYTTTLYREGSSEIDSYLIALEREIELRARQTAGAHGGSVYCGGGTPTAFNLTQLERLARFARTLAGSDGSRICFEMSPMTMGAQDGREKKQILVDAGVDRFSIGIQTFDPVLLPRHRGHDLETVLRALDMIRVGGRTLNIDLIQDLEGQTRESIQNDLYWINEYRPEQVTWYLLRMHAPSALAKRAASRGYQQIDDVESALRRAIIIEGMAGLGYRRSPGGRFLLEDGGDQYKAVRGGVDSHLLGLGVSSYSHGWGWFFRNVAHKNPRVAIRDYIDLISTGTTAVRWATEITAEEKTAGQLCQLSREHIPAQLLTRDDPVAFEARRTIETLVQAGVMSGDARRGYSPTEIGWLFEEEIASLFYSPRIRRRLESQDAYWAVPRVSTVDTRVPAIALAD